MDMLAAFLAFFLAPQDIPVAPAGWTVEVVARSPEVRHPSVVCCAPDGRLFVAEDPMDIVAPADQPLGRILCLFPDGRRTVFAERLYAVFGMQYLEGMLYVLHNPKFTRFADDGGVGRDRTDLLETTNPKPWALDWNDHVPSNFRLGMDGYFYISIGDKGVYGAVGRDGKAVQLRGGGILRMRPGATELEVFCTGTRNTLDVAINAEDELFTYDNTDEHNWMGRLTHMVDGGFYGYPWDFQPRRPYTLWMMADYGGGAATGALCYEEDGLPEEFRGNLFLADFGKRSVARVRIAREGASYAAVSREDFLTNGGPRDNFRPVGICLSPEGRSLYVADWHHEGSKGKVAAGRVLKVTFAGKHEPTPRPGDPGQALTHPAREVRLAAQRRLVELKAVETLSRFIDHPVARRHAIWALDAIDGGASLRPKILELARSGDLQAIRQLGTRRVAEAERVFVELLRDGSPAVRFHAAAALGRLAHVSSIPALQAALDEKDPVARFAVFTALRRIGDAHPEAWKEISGGLRSDLPRVREGTLFAMRDVAEPVVVEALSTATGEVRPEALSFLARIARKDPEWKGEWWPSPYHPALSPRPVRTVDWSGTPAALAALRAGLDDADPRVRRAVIDGFTELREPAIRPRLRERLGIEQDTAVKGALLRALGVLKDADALELIRTALFEETGPPEMRLHALLAAEEIGGKDAAALVARFLSSNLGSRELKLRAVSAAAKLGRPAPVEALLSLAREPDLELRKAALGALGTLKAKQAVPALVDAFGDEKTRFEAAEALSRIPDLRAVEAYLFGLASANAALRERSAEALKALGKAALRNLEKRVDFATLPPQSIAELQRLFVSERESPLFRVQPKKLEPAAYLEYGLRNPGDPARGRPLFHDLKGLACIKCHRVDGTGGEIGPDLTVIGSQFSRAELAESVVYPSRKIREGYQQVKVLTKDGRVLSGAVKGETPAELTLQDAEGIRHSIATADIEKRAPSELSLMPEGLHGGLSMQDFADLLSYLESLRPPKK
jgi:putative membrane-bound dehydrogenase-like protein